MHKISAQAAPPDLDEALARAATDNDPSISIVSAINDVMNDPVIELVDICLPPHLHTRYVLQALASGKHVVAKNRWHVRWQKSSRCDRPSRVLGVVSFPCFSTGTDLVWLSYQHSRQVV